ncbi:primosomal protein N' [Segetibacter sp. 3557_3]|uniref:replication restart helicase PriA n=1 Tax=Segetibacter sp. 3557_3 TaxID=2547429 RepID=UPI0010586EF1|nr:primosomal protein N' [Segetibacter sp. 3557_3]TDH29098.1 primosomal protein N' [Segetibacter sp. 3557_3]
MTAPDSNPSLFSDEPAVPLLPLVEQERPGEPQLYAEVIIPLALPRNYTWSIPAQFRQSIQMGSRVEVVLGKHKRYAGIVKTIHGRKPAAFQPKELLNVLDSDPLVFGHQLALWKWIAEYYMCSEGEVMQAALPSHLKLSSETILSFNEAFGDDFSGMSDEEFLVSEALLLKKELRLSEVQDILDISHVYPIIKKLIDKGVCVVWEALKEKYREKTETYVVLNPTYNNEEQLSQLLNNWSRAPKQMELLLAYLHLVKTVGEVTQPELLKKSNASPAQLKGLADKNILFLQKRSTDRIQSLPKDVTIDFELSDAQLLAADEVLNVFNDKVVCLLKGVTASGKTQIYIKLIEQFIKSGDQVLYMLPEIALTAQIIRRLQKHFGGFITIYHSKFNPNERVEIWNKIKTGETKVILGARSSLFLPFKKLGLVIVDEEHDPSFKQQEPAPRYHARDAAIYYASLFNAKVLLGSATPSIESYYNCQSGKYGLVTLTERFGNVKMPDIELVDVKTVMTKDRSKVILSPRLIEAITDSLQQEKQVILFQNRRGYSPYQICGTCGWIPQCENCDVTLTYHKAKNKLQCHYCGTTYPVILTCAACGSHNFMQKNFGTEKIEESLTEAFPQAKIARMDYDSIKGKHDHDALIKLFEQKKLDILAGTQMVVKGLDFEHVNLVGVIDADGILNFTDFRVNERAFQLMEQVSGRAGRRDQQGKVLIQVNNVKHPVLQFVKDHDYESMYAFEIENRKNFAYPPFTRIIQITFKHKEKVVAEEAANIMSQALLAKYANYLSGPAEPVVSRVRNQYLMELLLKLPKDAPLIHQCKRDILQQQAIIQSNKRYRQVHIIADVDAV